MIKIIFNNININLDFIKDNTKINYIKLINLLLYFDLPREDIEKLLIYINDELITSNDYKIINEITINIFIKNDESFNKNLLNEKLLIIFSNITINEEDEKNIIDILDKKNNNIYNIIKENNKKTIELLNNDDFIKLLQIYKNNSQLFIILTKYIYNDDNIIIEMNNKNDNDDEYQDSLITHLKKLNLITEPEILKKILEKNNNNLNLAIRNIINT